MTHESAPFNWRSVSVPDAFVNGTQFVRWTEDGASSIVRLRVDKDGYILCWTDAVNSDCLNLFSVIDVRHGRIAKHPKDTQTLATCTRFIEAFSIPQSASAMKTRGKATANKLQTSGEQATTGERGGLGVLPGETSLSSSPPGNEQSRLAIDACALTVYYGADSVNPNYVNFVAPTAESAKEWSNFILKVAWRSLSNLGNMVNFLELAYKELSVTHSERGKIPLKLLYRKFVQHRDDKDKVEKVLEACGLPTDKAQSIKCTDLTSEAYRRFIKMLLQRNDVENIFISLGAQAKPYLHITAEQFAEFLNKEQRDPRLNEVLHPFCTKNKAEELIRKYEPTATIANKRHLSVEGFYEYLISDENNVVPYDIFECQQDMTLPLSHYFINSSHNTYLTGHQLTGKSSVDYYRYVLMTGCRCIELDCWNGDLPDEEPRITHGFTMVTQIAFKDVIDIIAVSAFEVSEYPLILSFENHCSVKQQVKMVQYMKAVFGDMLLTEPLASHPLEPGVPLPSPAHLKRKIIVKSKKHVYSKAPTEKKNSSQLPGSSDDQDLLPALLTSTSLTNTSSAMEEVFASSADMMPDDLITGSLSLEIPVSRAFRNSATSGGSLKTSATDSRISSKLLGGDDVSGSINVESPSSTPVDLFMCPPDALGLASLVNYVDPVPFESFALTESRQCSFESSSFAEIQASHLLKLFPVEFVNYNKNHLSRIYPKGTRVDSSNFIPQLYWCAGVQMAALNFQTADLGMQLNAVLFELNGRCGYVLKPEFMRRSERSFDPFAQSIVDGIVAATLTIKIISGQFLTDRKVGTFVEVELYGVPHDTRRKQRSKIVANNALNPVYEEKAIEFSPIIVPQLAFLRLAVYDETSRLLGQRTLYVPSLRPGYRHVPLRNETNQPAGLATLFVHIRVHDYVPTMLADFAEALTNPIAHQQQLHIREQQMARLTDELIDDDADDELATGASSVVERRKNTNDRGLHPASPPLNAAEPAVAEPRRSGVRPNSTLSLPKSGIREALLSPINLRRNNANKFDVQPSSAPTRRKSNVDGFAADSASETASSERSPGAGSPAAESSRRSLNWMLDKLAATVNANKVMQLQDTAWKDMLPDSSVFSSEKLRLIRSMSDLKNTKEVLRLVRKLEKERQELTKRREKSRQGLLSEYGFGRESVPSRATVLARRVTTATVNAITLAKSTRLDRRKEAQTEISVDFDSAPPALHRLPDVAARSSLPVHTAQFALRGLEIDRQYEAEVIEWQKSSRDRLSKTMSIVLEEKFRLERLKLDAIYEEETIKMQVKQNRFRREINKQLVKDAPNKTELYKSRQEVLQQHIHYSVQARQQLIVLYERERDQLTQKQIELKRQVDEESDRFMESIFTALQNNTQTQVVVNDPDESSDL